MLFGKAFLLLCFPSGVILECYTYPNAASLLCGAARFPRLNQSDHVSTKALPTHYHPPLVDVVQNLLL